MYVKNSLGHPQLLRTITLNAPQGEVRLAPLVQNARPGDQLLLEIGDVYRINYHGQRVLVPFTFAEKMMSFTLTE